MLFVIVWIGVEIGIVILMLLLCLFELLGLKCFIMWFLIG